MANVIDSLNFDGVTEGIFTLPYGTCATAQGTAAKVATATNFVLEPGARIAVKFTYANTVASPTLNVNSTGAKAIYWHGTALASNQYWQAGAVLDFIYNGAQWELIGVATDTNTTYSAGTGISLSGTTFSNSGVRSVATGSSNGTISVNTNGTTANVAVKGLGSAAYTASTAYAAASHNQAASTITSGTLAAARLPNATTSAKGAVKVGSNLTVSSGTLSLSESNVINALGTDALSKLGIEVVNVCGSEGVTVTTTTAGMKMKMPITTVIGATKNATNYFTMQNGYLKTKKAGLYLITGNVYMTCAASASTGNWPSRAGVYIHTTNASVTANPDYTTWTEAAASIVFIPPNCEGDININTDIRLVYLNGGASISLVGRIAGGTSSGKLYCGGSSSLLVAYLGPTNGTIYNA